MSGYVRVNLLKIIISPWWNGGARDVSRIGGEARGAKAALTGVQRACVQHLHRDGMSQSALARRFGVQRRTIQR